MHPRFIWYKVREVKSFLEFMTHKLARNRQKKRHTKLDDESKEYLEKSNQDSNRDISAI